MARRITSTVAGAFLVAALISASAVRAQTPTYDFHDCGCGLQQQCATVKGVRSGSCQNTGAFLSDTIRSQRVTCESELKQCALLSLHDDNKCFSFSGFITPMCDMCQELGTPHLGADGVLSQYVYIKCNKATQSVTISSQCNSDCSSCPGGNHTHNFESCDNAVAHVDTWIVNEGITQCGAVRVRQYSNSGSCFGTPDVDRYVAQHYCSGVGMYNCSNAPAYQPDTGKNVLESTCALGCSYGCTYKTVKSGQCAPVQGPFPDAVSSKTTCGTGVSRCVNMAFFPQAYNCSGGFGMVYSAQCGSCNQGQFGLKPYHFMDCQSDGTVVIKECDDPLCNSCPISLPPRPPFQCVPARPWNYSNPVTDWQSQPSAFNFGIVPCTSVTTEWYSNEDCGGSPMGKFQIGEGLCSGHGRVMCGDFNLTSVKMTQCMCGENDPNCGHAHEFPSGACQTIQEGHSHGLPGMSYKIDCDPSPHMCARAIIFNDTSCNSFATVAQPVCGKCDFTPLVGYVMVNCNPSKQQTSISYNCDSTCSRCEQTNVKVTDALSGQCVTTITGGMSFQLRAIVECDAVRITSYNDSATCGGSPTGVFYRNAGQCAYGNSITCGASPKLPGPSTAYSGTGNLQVIQNVCPNTEGFNDCSGACTKNVYNSGVCVVESGTIGTARPFPNITVTQPPATVQSRMYTCGTPSYCADMVVFSGTSCSRGTYKGIMSAVCNRCNNQNGTYMRMRCDPNSGNIWWDLYCNSDCSSCNERFVNFHAPDSCVAGFHPNTMIVNKGMYRCETVDVLAFSSPTCSSSSVVGNFTMPAGECGFGTSFQCGYFNLPLASSPTTVTQSPCECGSEFGNTCAARRSFPSDTCQANPAGGTMMVACDTKPRKCASFAFFGQAACNSFEGVFQMVCGSCIMLPGNTYGKVVCDEHNMVVTVFMGCNGDCSKCTNPVSHHSPLAQCSPAEFGQATKELLTIAPCDAMIKLDYASSSCQGQPVFGGMLPQTWCSTMGGNVSFTCANRPSIAGFTAANLEILETRCNDAWCAQDCTATVHRNRDCVPMTDSNSNYKSQRFTCSPSSGSYCAYVIGFSGSTTCQSKPFLRTAKCGMCLFDPQLGNVKINCNGNDITGATIQTGCNSNCLACNTAKALNVSKQECTTAGSGNSFSIFNVQPCALVHVSQFTSSDCSGTAAVEYDVADGLCGANGRLQCGTDFSATFATNTYKNQVNYYDCRCNGPPATCGRANFSSGTCQPHLQVSQGFQSTRATCSTAAGWCAWLQFYNDSSCTTFKMPNPIESIVCNTCMQIGIAHYMVNCSSTSSTPVVRQCTSNTCSSCSNPVTLTLDGCNAIGGMNFGTNGVRPCRTVVVEQFRDSTNCTGAKVQNVVSQDWCNSGVFTCTQQVDFPYPTPPSQQNVLMQVCSDGTGCTQNCAYSTVKSGSCATTDFGGIRPTCVAKAGRCATFGVFRDQSCTKFLNIMTVACNKCQYFPAVGEYTYTDCDPFTQQVVLSTGCDSSCTVCKNVAYAVRDQFMCSPGIPLNNAWVSVSNIGIMNFGISGCDQISADIYTSGSCAASTKIGEASFGQGHCDGRGVFSCGDYNLQQVQRSRCDCGTSCNTTIERFESGKCHRIDSANSVIATCDVTPQMCTNVIVFGASDCSLADYRWKAAGVCGSCFYTPDTQWMRIECNRANQTVQLWGCNANCVSCPTRVGYHPVGKCSNGMFPGFSVFNLGINPCDAVTVQWYNSSNCASSTYAGTVKRAQGECAWGDVFQCATPPYFNNAPAVQAKTQVMLQSCPTTQGTAQFCTGDNCKISVHNSGVCFSGTGNARWPSNSSRYTCQGSGLCATMLVFQNAGSNQCNGVPSTLYTAPCGSCFHFNGGYNRVFCDASSRVVTWLEGCDANCRNCSGQPSVRPEHQCIESNFAPGTFILNRAMFPCQHVQVEHFSGNACDSNSVIVNFTATEGHCNWGDTFHCGEFNLPSTEGGEAVVTQRQCPCQGSSQCAASVFNESSCQPTTLWGPSGQPAPQWTQSISCNPRPAMCATVHAFGSPGCQTEWRGLNSIACGTCMRGGNGMHYRLSCDVEKQQVTFLQQCDATCSQCQPITGGKGIFPLFGCTAFNPGQYLQMVGIAPCATLTVMAYQAASCAGSPWFMQTVQQGVCVGEGFSATCNNAPALPATRFTQVLETVCPMAPNGLWVCNGQNCRNTILTADQCTQFTYGAGAPPPNMPTFYQKLSCSSGTRQCLDIALFNSSSTCDFERFQGIMSIACNSCIFNERFGTYLNVTCNANGVSVKNCTRGCTNCPNSFLHFNVQPGTCTLDPIFNVMRKKQDPSFPSNENMYVKFIQPYQCNAVTIDLYTNAQCSGAAVAQAMRSSGSCNGGVSYRCGNNFEQSLVNPTQAPRPADAIVFSLQLNAPFSAQTFSLALANTVSGAALDDISISVSTNATYVQFYFIGSQAADFQYRLQLSLRQDANATAALLGGSSISSYAPPAPTPPGPAPGGSAPESKKNTARTVEIVIGVLAGIGLLILGGLMFARRGRNSGSASAAGMPAPAQTGAGGVNVRPQDIEEPMYEQYRDGTF